MNGKRQKVVDCKITYSAGNGTSWYALELACGARKRRLRQRVEYGRTLTPYRRQPKTSICRCPKCLEELT